MNPMVSLELHQPSWASLKIKAAIQFHVHFQGLLTKKPGSPRLLRWKSQPYRATSNLEFIAHFMVFCIFLPFSLPIVELKCDSVLVFLRLGNGWHPNFKLLCQHCCCFTFLWSLNNLDFASESEYAFACASLSFQKMVCCSYTIFPCHTSLSSGHRKVTVSQWLSVGDFLHNEKIHTYVPWSFLLSGEKFTYPYKYCS